MGSEVGDQPSSSSLEVGAINMSIRHASRMSSSLGVPLNLMEREFPKIPYPGSRVKYPVKLPDEGATGHITSSLTQRAVSDDSASLEGCGRTAALREEGSLGEARMQ